MFEVPVSFEVALKRSPAVFKDDSQVVALRNKINKSYNTLSTLYIKLPNNPCLKEKTCMILVLPLLQLAYIFLVSASST